MSENKALKKENGQKPKVETTEEEVEGFHAILWLLY